MAAMKLQTAKNEFFRQVNDLQQQNQGKKSNAHPTRDNAKDYCPSETGTIVIGALATIAAPSTGLYAPSRLPSLYAPIAENPPEQL